MKYATKEALIELIYALIFKHFLFSPCCTVLGRHSNTDINKVYDVFTALPPAKQLTHYSGPTRDVHGSPNSSSSRTSDRRPASPDGSKHSESPGSYRRHQAPSRSVKNHLIFQNAGFPHTLKSWKNS